MPSIQEINPAKLALLFRREFMLCDVKPGETIALLSDLQSRPEYVAAAFAAAEELGADIYDMKVNSVPSWTKVGVETVGACKGTVEALAAADLLVCLHVPLFTKWLKRVRDAGTRVAAHHRCARRSRAVDGAARPEGGLPPCRRAARASQDHADHQRRRHRSHGRSGLLPHHGAVRLRRAARPVRPLGRRPCPYLPQRRLGARHGGDPARRHRDPALLPLCPGRDPTRDPRRPYPQDRGRARRHADAPMARRQQAQAPTISTATPSRISAGASIRRRAGMRSRSMAAMPSARAPRPAPSPEIFCSRPARTPRAAARATPRAITTCRCAIAA